MQKNITIFWFRRDLRLHDNAGLYYALCENERVLPIFIFDKTLLAQLENKYDRRVDFIRQAVEELQKELVSINSGLHVFYDTPTNVFKNLERDHSIKNVYANHDYEPYAKERDAEISDFLAGHNILFKTFKDQCIFEKQEVVKEDGKPYTVFTPYSNKWKKTLKPFYYKPYPNKKYFKNFILSKSNTVPSLRSMGFQKTDLRFIPKVKPADALIRDYKAQRDYPALNATTRLSIHLRFGTISIRQLVAKSLPLSETWLNELIWRDFYMMILDHFPYVAKSAFKKEYDHIPWRNNEPEFEKWCKGVTGFAIVDAGMRELNETGFMHNRVRMIVSSFLVKDLLIDWRWGEAYFAQKLNDFDMSANNGGWQWAAGCGCDAAPYFRIFNPSEQQKRFDPEMSYIKKWVPEFGTDKYPLPMIDHKDARLRTLTTYKRALTEIRQTQLF